MTENSPADYVSLVADQLIVSNPSRRERTVAELLNYLASTWEQQPKPMRDHAVAVARAHSGIPERPSHQRKPDPIPPRMTAGYTNPDELPMAPGCEHWRREHRDDLCPMPTCKRCRYLERL